MDNNIDNNENKKKIEIKGQSNRYQIKKLVKEKEAPKKRAVIDEWNLPKYCYTFDYQLELINKISTLSSTEKKELHEEIGIKQIEKKINGYKHQDIDKKVLDESSFVKFDHVITKMKNCEMKCFYCKKEMYIFYELVRENNQWTLDRINNDIGHVTDNVLISCLECNLKRRRTNKDKFLFTKQIKINREGL